MKNIYLNVKESEESRIIVAANGNLVDFEQELHGEENKKGNIYKGVVTNVEPSLEAVFMDLGEDKNGLLPLREIPPNALGVSEGGPAVGDQLLVQIKKDNIGDKGAGLTGYIAISGNFLVLMPYSDRPHGISSNADQSERKEMSAMLEGLPIPDNMRIIARSLAIQHSREDILWDLEHYLLHLWNAIKATTEKVSEPTLIYRENSMPLRIMRDYFRPDSNDVITCDDETLYNELRAFIDLLFPGNIEQIRYHSDETSMVPARVEDQIDKIYAREVSTNSGVRVVFDATEALVAIDVNSGRQRSGADIEETAFKTNLEAAEVIAEQLRLRRLSGLVVIDFIDMKKAENRAELEKRVADLFRRDRARTRISKISEFGLMELSRQRTYRSLLFSQVDICPRCKGSGQTWRDEAFALHLLRKARVAAFSAPSVATLIMHVPYKVGLFLLNQKREELRRIEQASGCEFVITPDSQLQPPQYKFKPVKGDKRQGLLAANQIVQQTDASTQAYQRPTITPEKQPVLQNMLPEQRMPSKQEGGFWDRLKKFFSGEDEQKPASRRRSRSQRGGKRRANGGGGGGDGGARRNDEERQKRGERGERGDGGKREGRGGRRSESRRRGGQGRQRDDQGGGGQGGQGSQAGQGGQGGQNGNGGNGGQNGQSKQSQGGSAGQGGQGNQSNNQQSSQSTPVNQSAQSQGGSAGQGGQSNQSQSGSGGSHLSGDATAAGSNATDAAK